MESTALCGDGANVCEMTDAERAAVELRTRLLDLVSYHPDPVEGMQQAGLFLIDRLGEMKQTEGLRRLVDHSMLTLEGLTR